MSVLELVRVLALFFEIASALPRRAASDLFRHARNDVIFLVRAILREVSAHFQIGFD